MVRSANGEICIIEEAAYSHCIAFASLVGLCDLRNRVARGLTAGTNCAAWAVVHGWGHRIQGLLSRPLGPRRQVNPSPSHCVCSLTVYCSADMSATTGPVRLISAGLPLSGASLP